MRTGQLQTLSSRDYDSLRARREWVQQENEKERLAEDQAEYAKYSQIVDADNLNQPPDFKIDKIDFATFRSFCDPDQSDPVLRGAMAVNRLFSARLDRIERDAEQVEHETARQAISAGERDPGWCIPDDAQGLSMSIAEAKYFNGKQADLFKEHNPTYFPSEANKKAIIEYLIANRIGVVTESSYRAAWLRLKELGLIEERPVPDEPLTPEPEPQPEEESQELSVPLTAESDLVDGFDIETGEPRKYSQKEIWKMDSRTYVKAFKAWGDNGPRFTRGWHGPR